jgi:hypothetical protein
MVRVKVACKDVTKIPGKRVRKKIPGKRLFERRKNSYLIQFKAEGMSDVGMESSGEDGGNDQGYDEDEGFEEVELNDNVVNGNKVGEKKKSSS